jgi:hypothetical protein
MLFRPIYRWMYTGIVRYRRQDLLHMIQICRDCGVEQVEQYLVSLLPDIVRKENLIDILKSASMKGCRMPSCHLNLSLCNSSQSST